MNVNCLPVPRSVTRCKEVARCGNSHRGPAQDSKQRAVWLTPAAAAAQWRTARGGDRQAGNLLVFKENRRMRGGRRGNASGPRSLSGVRQALNDPRVIITSQAQSNL